MKQTIFLKCSAHLFIGAIPKFNFKFLIEFFITVVLIKDNQFHQTFCFGERKSLESCSLTQGFNKADRVHQFTIYKEFSYPGAELLLSWEVKC